MQKLTFSADHDLGFQLFDVTGEAGGLPQLFIIFALADKVLEGREVESVPNHSCAALAPSYSALPMPTDG